MGLVMGRPAAAHDTAVPASGHRVAVALAAGLSLFAGWAHFAYTESHFEDWWAYGVFFLVSALAQSLFAPAFLRRPAPALALAAVLLNVGIVGMYAWSRVFGVPLGPHTGVVEHTKLPDLAATAAEILLVAVLLALLPRRWTSTVTTTLLVAGLALWASRLTGYAP